MNHDPIRWKSIRQLNYDNLIGALQAALSRLKSIQIGVRFEEIHMIEAVLKEVGEL